MKCPKGCKFLKDLINDIENSDFTTEYMMSISDSLLHRVKKNNKLKYLIDYEKTYYLKRGVEGLHSKLINFKSLDDIYTIHLFENSIRLAHKESDNFKININNLKQFLLWDDVRTCKSSNSRYNSTNLSN